MQVLGMKSNPLAGPRAGRVFPAAADGLASDAGLDEFASLTAQETHLDDFPFAAEVASKVLVYDCDAIRGSKH
jgi:hypothetical protein